MKIIFGQKNTILKKIINGNHRQVQILLIFGISSALLEFGTVTGLFYLMKYFQILNGNTETSVNIFGYYLQKPQVFLYTTLLFIVFVIFSVLIRVVFLRKSAEFTHTEGAKISFSIFDKIFYGPNELYSKDYETK